MTEISVRTSLSYVVHVGQDILQNVGEILSRDIKCGTKILVVTDENVAPLYLEIVLSSLQKSGYSAINCVLPSGESTKSLENFAYLCSFAAKNGLGRDDVFVALGGGVIGDLTGFAASCFMRGVRYVQLPTTLLAAIDSSVGGKTAVNIEEGKNLVGAFHQPTCVICDTQTLDTLPHEEKLCGIGEAVKYAVLSGGRIFEILRSGIDEANIEELVTLCIEAKVKIVEEDETEHGRRKLLNLGHTFGHAIEKLSKFSVPHGIAVVKGLSLLAKAQLKEKSISESCFSQIDGLIKKYGFDAESGFCAKDIAAQVVFDKKCSFGSVSLIKIKDIGDCYAENVEIAKLEEMLK